MRKVRQYYGSIANIKRRLIAGEDFTLFDTQYRFMDRPAMDGIYHYNIRDKDGIRVGAARFTARKVLLAFSYGRFSIPLRDFKTITNEQNNKAHTWDPGYQHLPLQPGGPAHI